MFLDGLKTAGANVVFFNDEHMQNDKCEWWCKKEDNNQYNAVYEMLSKNYINGKVRMHFKCLILLQSVIQMIKRKNFGEVYISIEVECDRSIAKHTLDQCPILQ